MEYFRGSDLSGNFAHHLNLSEEDIAKAKIALLPGDPGRVPLIAEHLKDGKEIAFKREFRTFLGHLNDKAILVTSTGMGGPSLSICVEELARLGVRDFIRIGSAGSIQEHIQVTDAVIFNGAVRLDGSSESFAPIEYPAVADFGVTRALIESAEEKGVTFHVSIAATTGTFYQGQERYDTYTGFVPAHLRGSINDWRAMRVAAFEMETATLFTMCSTMGLRAGCVCGIVAKRTLSEELATAELFKKCEQNAIEVALGAASRLLL